MNMELDLTLAIIISYILLIISLTIFFFLSINEVYKSWKEKNYRWYLTFWLLGLHTFLFIVYLLGCLFIGVMYEL